MNLKSTINNCKKILAESRHYFHLRYYYQILRRDREHRTYLVELLQKALAVTVVSVNRFINDAGVISASALTYYTILAFVPVIAILFAVAKGFGAYNDLESLISQYFSENTEIVDQLVHYANHAIDNTKGGIITGVGIFLLLWAILRVLSSAEITMNRIWRIKKGRNLRRMITEYFSVIIIAPILIILGSSINVFLTTNLENYLPILAPWVMRLLKLLPYFFVWILFIFVYMFIPAISVRFKHAFWAGMIAGTLYQVVQWFYLRFQIGVSSYNAIYGSLAALPLLLVWLQLSWSIMLWGTELCYILKNRHFMYKSELYGDESWMTMIETGIQIVRYIAGKNVQQQEGVSPGELSKHFGMNVSKVQLILDELVERHILVENKSGDELSFMLDGDVYNLSVSDVIINLSRVNESKDEVWKNKFETAIRNGYTGDKFV